MKSKSILLTGASGFLGSSLVKRLSECFHLSGVAHSKPGKWRPVDLADKQQTEDLLCEMKPDIVVHTVALTNVDRCEKEPALAYCLNVKTMEYIVNWLKVHSPQTHLVHISSDQVYNGPGPHSEKNASPHNVYALSKYYSELAALSYPCSLVLRTNFFGWSESADKESFSDWALNSLKNKKHIKLVEDVYFSPLYLNTLAEYIEYCCKIQLVGLFNIGASSGCSKRDFVHLLAERFGFSMDNTEDVKVADLQLESYRPCDMRMEVDKFSDATGLTLPTMNSEIERLYKERPREWR